MVRGKTQYKKPIGPSRPIGRDTQGKFVFPSDIDTGKKDLADTGAKSPDWNKKPIIRGSGGGSGGSGTNPTPSETNQLEFKTDISKVKSETQRQKLQQQRDRLRNERQFENQLREMNPRERKEFLRDLNARNKLSQTLDNVSKTGNKLDQKSTLLLRNLEKRNQSKEQTVSVTLERKQIDTFRGTPIFKIIAKENGKERSATKEEELFFQKQSKTVTSFEKPTGLLKGTLFDVERSQEARVQQGKTTGIKENLKGFGMGIAVSGLGTLSFLKDTATDPVGTGKAVIKGIPQTPQRLQQFGRTLKQDPSFATGIIATEVATVIAGSKGLTKLKIPRGKKGASSKGKGKTKQKQEQKQKTKEKPKKKVDIDKVIEDLSTKKQGKTIRDKTFQERLDDANKIFNEIKKETNPQIRQRKIREFKDLLDTVHGEMLSNRILKEVFEEQGLLNIRNTQFATRTGAKPTGTATKALPKTLQGTKGALFFKQAQPQLTQQKQKSKQQALLKVKQDTKQKTQQKTLTLLKSATAQKTAQATKQLNFFRNVNDFKQKLRPKPKPKLTPKKKITPQQKALIDKLLALKKQGKSLDIVTGMKVGKERIIERNLPVYLALRKAQRFVDDNIEASFRLKVNPKKPKRKDISKVNLNNKFRPSKTNPLFNVEKRKFRLDSFQEKKQIKSNKKLKKSILSFK